MTTLLSVIAKYRAIFLALRDIDVESCSSESRANALSYIHLPESSSFLVALVVAQYILSFSKPLCLALQKESTDIGQAYEKAKTCCSTIKAQRSDDKFSKLWKKVVAIGAEIDVEIRKPRTATRSQYRSNIGSTDDSAEVYYRRNVYLPFLDHCVSEFQTNFLILQIQSSQGTNYSQTK